ncbi:MAG: recombinase family protein [Planctomycetes bacterium]|nr:recombinase family protein [Planctomycetota bacterium]
MIAHSAARRRTHRSISTAAAIPPRRVAIYTRKSTDEGLDSAFSSLDAQRQAVEAYIESQRGEGWLALPGRFDDGGYSGATTERPAFKRLVAEITAGNVDIVAVYKIDRLSRSLADFTRLMALFAEHGVAFVSVTQQFSTTTAVGRMTLNLLATFAEFERETIVERTRDKVRAARCRGMWTGGHTPLGYDLVDGALVVNAQEAERARAIFALYLETGTLSGTCAALRQRGWEAKRWINREGKETGGGHFDIPQLRRLLTNPVYRGLISSVGALHRGQHEAILGEPLWARVQARLTQNAGHRQRATHEPWNAPLTGLLRCRRCDRAMSHTYARRHGKAYRYYACQSALKGGAHACPAARVPASGIEELVIAKVQKARPGAAAEPAALRQAVASVHYDAEAGEITIRYCDNTEGAPK